MDRKFQKSDAIMAKCSHLRQFITAFVWISRAMDPWRAKNHRRKNAACTFIRRFESCVLIGSSVSPGLLPHNPRRCWQMSCF